ncbi:MAG: hypothetical protein DBY23_03950 [Bacillota bacterium]|nr:MAG: hypothetical protein DBY23_03950 [Bacillota bacterium]
MAAELRFAVVKTRERTLYTAAARPAPAFGRLAGNVSTDTVPEVRQQSCGEVGEAGTVSVMSCAAVFFRPLKPGRGAKVSADP